MVRYWFFEGAYFRSYWTKFCVSKWVGFYNKNGLKHKDNSLTEQLASYTMGSYLGGLIIGRIFASEIWEGLFSERLIIGIFKIFRLERRTTFRLDGQSASCPSLY